MITSTSTSTSRDEEQFMPRLLDRVGKAKSKAIAKTGDQEAILSKFKTIEDVLQKMQYINLLPTVELWEKNLFKQFILLEHRVDRFLWEDDSNTSTSLEAITGTVAEMTENVNQIITTGSGHVVELMQTTRSESALASAKKMSKKWPELGLEKEKISQSPVMADMRSSYEHLESTELRLCFLSFSVFPVGSVIKKRPLIYWWIGEGFITGAEGKTAEEAGEKIFGILMERGLIQPHGNVNLSTSCKVHPWIRCMLMCLAREAQLFNFDLDWPWMPSCKASICRRACLASDQNQFSHSYYYEYDPKEGDLLTVFNANIQYLSFRRDWLSRLKKVVVLQLGRWQSSPAHHIEVHDESFLQGLGDQKFLKYLSLRGVSGITKLPSCIVNLISLEILDLKACHNLEKLPSDLSPLRKLTHLDVSECYFLQVMPRGLDKLSSLQVLKDFVMTWKNNSPTLGDLAKLEKLKRLSIRIYERKDAVIPDGEFRALERFSSLRRLKISWRVASPESKENISLQSLYFSFPPDLEKLDLQGIPLKEVPPWLNPRQLKNLKKLYIRGGELCSLDHAGEETVAECKWRVEILRLKYLRNMKIELPKVEDQFPHLLYLEKVKCHEKDIFWSKSQGQKLSNC